MTTSEYEQIYAHHIPLLNQARETNDRAGIDLHGEAIYKAAETLVRSALAGTSGPTGSPLVGDDLDLAVNAALDHIVNVATKSWQPESDIPFSAILTSRRSSWRKEARNAVHSDKVTFRLTEADRNVLSIAHGFATEFTHDHGREPTREEIIQGVRDYKATAESENDSVAAKNKKKGFDAAVSHIDELLAATTSTASIDKHWDDPESRSILESLHTGPAADSSEESNLEQLAALSGVDLASFDKTDKLRAGERLEALSRVTSPHAQWAFASYSHT